METENRKEIKEDELKNVNGGFKIIVEDKDKDKEELNFFEKLLKIIFKN